MTGLKLLFVSIAAMFSMNGLLYGQQNEPWTVGNNGNIGIGTDNPAVKLDIYANGYGVRHSSADGATQFATWVNPDQVNVGSISDHMLILTVNNALAAVFLPNGNAGLGTQTPNHPLEMASGAHVTAGGVWTNASSREY